MLKRLEVRGKTVLFITRERYYVFVAEHEVILIPRHSLPLQVKRFTDAVKITTLEPEWKNVSPYKVVGESVWSDYLEELGYRKDEFISKE
jgi:hypothetical protein